MWALALSFDAKPTASGGGGSGHTYHYATGLLARHANRVNLIISLAVC